MIRRKSGSGGFYDIIHKRMKTVFFFVFFLRTCKCMYILCTFLSLLFLYFFFFLKTFTGYFKVENPKNSPKIQTTSSQSKVG